MRVAPTEAVRQRRHDTTQDNTIDFRDAGERPMDGVLEFTGLSGASPALLAVVVSTVVMFATAVFFLVTAGRLRRSNNRKAALWARLESTWGRRIEKVEAGGVDVAAFHAGIAAGERAILLDYLYKAILQEPDPAREALYRELARPYLGLLEQRIRTGDVWQRARALRTLSELSREVATPLVEAALDDEAPHVAMTAARIYARLGLGGVEPLLARVERYRNWDRRLLRSVLVSFGPDAAPLLHERYADASLPARERAVCADALAALGHTGAGDAAAALLGESGDVDLLAASLRLLQAPATASQRAAVRALCAAEDDVLRGLAVACLARIGEGDDLDVVERAMADLSPWVTRSATLGMATRMGMLSGDGTVGTPAGTPVTPSGVPVMAPDPQLVAAGMGAAGMGAGMGAAASADENDDAGADGTSAAGGERR